MISMKSVTYKARNETVNNAEVRIRSATLRDIEGILDLKARIAGISLPCGEGELASQITFFREGQLVAESLERRQIIGAVGTLVISRFDYSLFSKWCDLTASGTFRNHDPRHGRTLFRSHLLVDPHFDESDRVRDALSQAELEIAVRLRMERIRAGVRLRDYYLFQHLSPADYFKQVARGRIRDRWVRQTLDRGFKALALVHRYYPRDTRSEGNAVMAQLDLQATQMKETRALSRHELMRLDTATGSPAWMVA